MRSKKIIYVLIALLILINTFPICAVANSTIDTNSNQTEGGSLSGAEVDKGGALERILAGIVEVPIIVVKYLISKAGMKPIDELVFLNGVSVAEKKTAPWSAGEVRFIQLWYLALAGIAMPIFLIVIIITAYKLMFSGVNPGMRVEAIESIWRWFGALLIMVLAPLLVQTFMNFVGLILDGIQAGYIAVANAAGIHRPVADLGQVNFDNVVTGSVLGTAIVKCMLFFIYLWINTIYLVRKLALSVMLCFTPFMAIMWALNKNVNAAAIWAGELASNAFMPVAHALVLCLVLGLCDVKSVGTGSWFTILVFIYTIMPLTEVIRNSMQNLFARASGLNEAGIASSALTAAMGLGGLASLARVGRSTFQGAGGIKGNIPLSGSGSGRSPRFGGIVNTATGAGAGAYAGRTTGNAPASGSTASPGAAGGRTSGGGAAPVVSNTAGNSAESTQEPPKWARRVVKGAGLAGAAMGSVIGLAAGAIPGGREIGGMIGNATVKSARFIGATGALMGIALQDKLASKTSYMQSIKNVTNTEKNGIKGLAESAWKIAQVGAETARSGKFEPNRITYKPPGRGLE